MAILELKDVCYCYSIDQKEKNVLDHVDSSFEQGKVYAIIGKSGSGKTTLLSLMAGLDIPKSGQVVFEGSATNDLDLNEYRRHCASVIYQSFCLFPLLTALENIMYPMELCQIDKNKALADAKSLAEKVSLPEGLLNRYPGKISGGEQQRVAIARALAMDRRLLLADEPTGSLDGENSDLIMDLLIHLAHDENRCVIVVTHDLLVMERADEVFRLSDNKLQRYR